MCRSRTDSHSCRPRATSFSSSLRTSEYDEDDGEGDGDDDEGDDGDGDGDGEDDGDGDGDGDGDRGGDGEDDGDGDGDCDNVRFNSSMRCLVLANEDFVSRSSSLHCSRCFSRDLTVFLDNRNSSLRRDSRSRMGCGQ